MGGGSSDDTGTGVAVDASGNAYLSGYTASPNFPVTSGVLHATYGGGNYDGFVVKFNSGGAELGYSTFLGGSADDYAYGVAVDSAGDAYVTGATNSTNFPTVNAFQPNYAGGLCAVAPNTFPCYDAFVAKLNPAGSALIFSTYFGGTGSDYGYAIALDGPSNAYVTGYTTSANLPTTAGAFDRVFGGSYGAFVAKLNGAGSTLAYSTYLGGSGTQIGYGVAVDSSGRAFVTGYNYGGYFPTALPLQAQNAGFYNAFVSVLNATGSSLVFSTYLGGSSDDFGRGISLDPSGSAYVTGATFSLDFPTTSGSYQPAYEGGPYDAFVTKMSLVPSPSLLISPSSYKFANQAVGVTSSPQTATLTNVGAAGLVVTGVVASGDFAETGTCISSSPIAANGACTGSVTFTPTAIGARTGALTITDNANIRPQTVTLTGMGMGAATSLSPTILSFGNQADSTRSAAQTVTLLNTGNSTLNVTNVTIAGTNSSGFTQTNNCGAPVAAGASCTPSVTFTPTVVGSQTGTLTITDNATPATQTVSLTGTGTMPVVGLSPTSLTFPAQPVGTSSSSQSVTFSNTGSASLSITNITASGDFSDINTCGSSVAASASCTLSVTFKPTVSGARTGAVTITDNASPSTQTVSLTGTGTVPAVSLSLTSLTFPAQQVGASSSAQSVTLSNTGDASLSITSITASGDFSRTNTCGSSVAASASCALTVTFKPTLTGTRTGAITITDSASPATQTVSLTGTGTAPAVSLSLTSLTFTAQQVGASSGAQSVTLTNTGSASLSFASITASGDFSQTNTCGSSLASSASCALSVTFKPTATGTRTGTVTITDNATPATQTVSLTGTGVVAPMVSLSSASLNFPAQKVGTSSSAQSVTLKNAGSASLSITSITASGDFSQTNTCGSSVAASASCTLSVTFKPTVAGARTGAVTITDNASPTTQTVSLTGTGGAAPVVSLSLASLTFSAQPVGSSSSPQSVKLSNTGNGALGITSITASGDFSQTNTCGSSVAASASCTPSVTFKPTATGSRSGTLTITDNASPATQTVSLTGTGAAAPTVSLSSASLTFSAQLEGVSSSAQSVTLTNTGSVALTITSVTASGDFSQTNSCGSSVAAGASCTASVTFKPTAGGSRAGNLTIADNGVGNPQSVALTGTGEDFTFTAPSGSSTSATVSPGQSASYALTVVGVSGFSQNVTFTCTGAPSGANCTFSPSPLTVSRSSTNVTVRVTTTAPSVGAPRPNPLPPMAPLQSWPWLPWIVALAVLGSLGRATRAWVQPGMGRGRAGFVSLVALFLLMAAVAACGGSAGGGGGGSDPLRSSSGTPAGTYTLTATGTFRSGSTVLSHSVNLTLKVT
ncbi:MAG: choice-of-anchor D domain-containing protein [Terriglobia bacterium]